jgi:hypothetical protein
MDLKKENHRLMLEHPLPYIKAFDVPDDNKKVIKEPYEYRISSFLFPTTFGTPKTTEFIESLAITKNDEILRSEPVQSYTQYMWKRVRSFIII